MLEKITSVNCFFNLLRFRGSTKRPKFAKLGYYHKMNLPERTTAFLHILAYSSYLKGIGYLVLESMLCCYWRQNSPKCYFASNTIIALNLTLTLTLTLNPAPTLIQTKVKCYFACRGKIAISYLKCMHNTALNRFLFHKFTPTDTLQTPKTTQAKQNRYNEFKLNHS